MRDLTGGFTGSLLTIAVLLVGSAVLAVSLRRSVVNDNGPSDAVLEIEIPARERSRA